MKTLNRPEEFCFLKDIEDKEKSPKESFPTFCRRPSPLERYSSSNSNSLSFQREWKVAPIPKDLLDRRVEITGPVSRKMVINALNSGAKVFMADFEDCK